MVKKDLTEFSTVMQKETEKVVEKTSSHLKDSLHVSYIFCFVQRKQLK